MSFPRVKNAIVFLVSLAVLTATIVPAALEARVNPKIRVTLGQSVTHRLDTPVKTVSIADSDVADVVVAGPREVLVNGKAIGLTTLVIWDDNNVSRSFDVIVRSPFSDQQIELRVQLAEVNRTRAFELGFDFLAIDDDGNREWTGATFGGPVSTPSIPLALFNNEKVEEVAGALQYVSGGATVQTMIRAAISNGVLHVLAEPNVVASSGRAAEFLSGGEIPVPIASAGAQGGSTITIDWREFGVKVGFLPTIVDSNVVNLYVKPEVSSLDFGSGIEISGFRVPALRTRRAETTVELKDGETLVVGGLLMEEESQVKTRIPLLGHIPLLGALFTDTQSLKSTTELVLVVSPRIVRALPRGASVELPDLNDDEK